MEKAGLTHSNPRSCCSAGGEPTGEPRAAAAGAEGERAGAPNAAGVPEPAGPHAHLLPHGSHRRLSAPPGGAGV